MMAAIVTNNADLAAFLWLNGFDPVKIIASKNADRIYERSYTFPGEARSLVRQFWCDDLVPVRSFARARRALRELPLTDPAASRPSPAKTRTVRPSHPRSPRTAAFAGVA